QEGKLIRQWLHIEHPDSPAHRGFSVPQWVPCKTDARLKILQCGIAEKGIAQMSRGICDVPQICELAFCLRHQGWHRVAQAPLWPRLREPAHAVLRSGAYAGL